MNSTTNPKLVPSIRTFSSAPLLLAAAIISALLATGIDLLIARVATPIVQARADYPSFTWFPIFVGCVVGAIGAAMVFAVIQRRSRQANQTLTRVAVGVLIASYSLPVVPLVMPIERFVGVNWGIAFVLMFMHTVTAAVITLAMLRVAPPQG